MTAALLLTVVLSGVGLPQDCEPQRATLERWVKAHAETVRRPLVAYVVPFEAAADDNDVAWTFPHRRKNEMWVRLDFLCTASDSAIELTVSHETFHLVNPGMSHVDIESALAAAVGRESYEAHRAELASAFARMEVWRAASVPRSRLHSRGFRRR